MSEQAPTGRVVRRFLITGKVQGVYFRHSTRVEAVKLDVLGVARNLADGSVEVIAEGEVGALEALSRWLQRGPPMARVDAVRELAVEDTGIRRTTGFSVE